MRRYIVVTAGVLVFGAIPINAQIVTAPTTTARAIPPRTPPRLLPGTRAGVFSTIQGNARLGQVIDAQTTDKAGLFTFRGIEPGSYIVELVGVDEAVLAASQILAANGADLISAIVKLPFRAPVLQRLIGDAVGSATAVTAQAASSGVLAATTTEPISPNR